MQVLVCDGTWSVASGSPVCNGTLLATPTNAIPGNGMSLEDAQTLKDGALLLFVSVFCILALKKVANLR